MYIEVFFQVVIGGLDVYLITLEDNNIINVDSEDGDATINLLCDNSGMCDT